MRDKKKYATILTFPSTDRSGILLSATEPNTPEGQEYETSTSYRFTGRSFTNPTQKQRQLLLPLNNLENGSFRNRKT